MSDPIIIATCPALAATGAYRVTSPATRHYNCVAWAASRTDRWWWPGPFAYWPAGVPNEETVAAFEAAYTTLGYSRCPDGRFELAFERVAIFALAGVPKHAARQLDNGRWTSKLGKYLDVEHLTADAVGGPMYGQVVSFMQRPRPIWRRVLALVRRPFRRLIP